MSRGRLRWAAKILLAVCAVAGTAVVLAAGLVHNGGAPQADSSLPLTQRPNHPAPALAGETLHGDPFSLTGLRGHVVVINVMASWCAPCRAELPVLEQASTRWADSGVRIVGIAMRDDPDDARALLAETGTESMTVVPDPDGTMAVDLGVRGVPETFVLDPAGTVRLHAFGPISAEWLEQWLPKVVSS
jgi:cytochrome c biogenesis protein CcmG, thiol:disulfide interchange protein DsbE